MLICRPAFVITLWKPCKGWLDVPKASTGPSCGSWKPQSSPPLFLLCPWRPSHPLLLHPQSSLPPFHHLSRLLLYLAPLPSHLHQSHHLPSQHPLSHPPHPCPPRLLPRLPPLLSHPHPERYQGRMRQIKPSPRFENGLALRNACMSTCVFCRMSSEASASS